ncbi:MAG: AAA family ATPase, partial [Planctomycetales bacterium]|nr:AAA family ATPase [Planctomycetales bacterium]
MRTLQRLKITNFKSIREQELSLGRLNLFIGGNGAGKSNLIEVFRFLIEIVRANLAGYVQFKGGADALLHYGRQRSTHLEFELVFGGDVPSNGYRVRLQARANDSLFISAETVLNLEDN